MFIRIHSHLQITDLNEEVDADLIAVDIIISTIRTSQQHK